MQLLALSDVETVALWAGLIVGVASVVLAIVAIYFSIEVDRRSTATSTSTIRSLERIESVVAGQSKDTRDLIKVGWERMLPPSARPASMPAPADEGVREVAAGLADEIRSNLGLSAVGGNVGDEVGATDARWDDVAERLQATVESQLQAARHRPGDEVQFWLDRLEDMSVEAQTLAQAISRHITSDQLRELQEDPLMADALSEMRREGLLVPLRGYNRKRERTLVYWFPPSADRAIKAALLMLADPDEDLTAVIAGLLERVGYPDVPSRDTE